jgi:hypothetical protein
MKCPKCGKEIDVDCEIAIWSMGGKQIKVWHLDCDGKWTYKRKG